MPIDPHTSWHLLGQAPSGHSETPDPWSLLDAFLCRLQEPQSSSSRQVRLTLETIQQMTHADVVFACALGDEGAVEQVGPSRQSETWCRQVTKQLLSLVPENDGHYLGPLRDHLRLAEPRPHSAAMVRLSRSRRVWLVALMLHSQRGLKKSDVQLMRLARRMLLQQNRQAQTFGQLRDALFSLVRCLTSSLDARDPYTWGHSERVARMAVRLAHEMGLPEGEISDLYLGGLLHDIGKIGVRDDVLRKPGPLTEEERAMIEKHTVIGDAILSNVGQLTHLRPIVRNHHERWDGRGYPDRLSGTGIPLPARILAVADGCDAMLSDRPYRKGMAPERIDLILREGAGSHWDPDVVGVFFACCDDIYSVHQQGVGDSVARALEQVLNGNDPITSPTSISEFSIGTPDS